MKYFRLIATLFFVLFNLSILYAQDKNFTKISFPFGVKIEVPKNWWIMSGDINTTIETASEAAINLSGFKIPVDGRKTNLFRANSMPKTTYAGIAINISDAQIAAQDLRSLPASELAELTPIMKGMMKKMLSQTGLSVIEFYPLEKKEIDGQPALILNYKRSGPQGPVIVKMTQLIIGSKALNVNLSYRESEATLWKPIVGYMEKSLKIEKISSYAEDYNTFVSKEFSFSAQYPKEWSKGTSVHAQTLLKVESKNGNDFNINAIRNDVFVGKSPKDIAESVNTNIHYLIKIMKKNKPGTILIENGISTLSSQPASYYIIDVPISAMEQEIIVRMYVIQTWFKDIGYTLTFRGAKKSWDEYFPLIQKMALAFQVHKLPSIEEIQDILKKDS